MTCYDTKQAVNFTCYEIFKKKLSAFTGRDNLAPWQHMILGGLSGGIGPCVNNPLDVVKTRLQKQVRYSTVPWISSPLGHNASLLLVHHNVTMVASQYVALTTVFLLCYTLRTSRVC